MSTIQHNKLIQLENSMVMYGIYNAETLEQLINTVHCIHNITSSNERLFAERKAHCHYDHYMQMHKAYNTTP